MVRSSLWWPQVRGRNVAWWLSGARPGKPVPSLSLLSLLSGLTLPRAPGSLRLTHDSWIFLMPGEGFWNADKSLYCAITLRTIMELGEKRGSQSADNAVQLLSWLPSWVLSHVATRISWVLEEQKFSKRLSDAVNMMAYATEEMITFWISDKK